MNQKNKNKIPKKKTMLISAIIIVILFGVLVTILIISPQKLMEKKPILWFKRAINDKGETFDLNIKGKRLYISDGNKLISFNLTKPNTPLNKVELPRPQGVIASYIHGKYLFEITAGKRVRISTYNKPAKVISLIDQFEVNTKLQFYNNYVFIGSGKNIAVIRLGEAIEIFNYNTYLVDVVDIGIIGNILVVTVSDGTLKIYDITELREPLLVFEILKKEGVSYTHITSSDKYLFAVEKQSLDGKKYIVNQFDVKNLDNILWRQVLLSYEKITKISIKDEYFGVIRENIFLDIYKIDNNKLASKLTIMGYELSDFDIYNKHLYISEKKTNEYLKLYEID